MKISYNWLKDYINIEHLTIDQLSELLTNCGLEVEGYETTESIKGGLKGLVIGEVVAKEKHPDADRLSVTKVKISENEPLLNIVCGAPNVAEGQKVVVAPVGCTIYPLEGEPFKINKSKIRGQVSEGMICAEDEIGLGTSHDGIMVLNGDASIGKLASDFFGVETDVIFEIGLTPNRADATSHIGVARDIAAVLNQTATKNLAVNFPAVDDVRTANNNLSIEVKVEDKERCPRYSSISITNVEVKESPNWLKNKLLSIGLNPINNVVDITNFVLHETGQPLHAFDADKIADKKIIIKTVTDKTKFITLDGTERTLSDQDLMICDTEKPLCIAGVFGGATAGVTNNTKQVFLESAYFNPVTIRKTSKRHGLNTDASFRYERGADPNITIYALKRAAQLIQQVAGGIIASEVNDVYPEKINDVEVVFHYSNCDRLIGKQLDRALIKNIIISLGITIVKENDNELELCVPPFKVDVTREVDVIEEILRVYGYNNVEIPSKMTTSITQKPVPDKEKIVNIISDLLVNKGFNELFSNSLTKKSYYDNQTEDLVELLNPLSNELGVMRKTLLYNGLETIVFNQNRKSPDLSLFEIGKVYSTADGKFKETNCLGLFVTGKQHPENWNTTKENSNFYHLKGVVTALLEKFGIEEDKSVSDISVSNNFAYGLTFFINNIALVQLGEVSFELQNQFEINQPVYFAQLNLDEFISIIKKNNIIYRPISKFPPVRRDLSLLLDTPTTYEALKIAAFKQEKRLLKKVNLFDVYEGKNLEKGKKSYAMSFIFQDENKTLTDNEVDKVMQKLIFTYTNEFNAIVR